LLVDTSVWVDHLRHRNAALVELLTAEQVRVHPFVIGELACGNLAQSNEVLGLLAALPRVPVVDHDEVITFVEDQHLMGRGLGWIDVHLLASAALASVAFWTLDKRLSTAGRELGLVLSGA
jgi:predicted nucleic acid-binding protein